MLALKTTAADMLIAVRRRKLRGRGSDRSGRIRFTSAPTRPACRPTTVRRLTAAWQDEHERWQQRALSARRYVYLWADGLPYPGEARPGHKTVARTQVTRPPLDHQRVRRDQRGSVLEHVLPKNGRDSDSERWLHSWPPESATLK